MNKRLERIKKTPEAMEEKLNRLGAAIEARLMGVVEPEGKLDEDGNFVEMTYHGLLVQPNRMGRYDRHQVSVTIPDNNDEAHRYAVTANDRPIEWLGGADMVDTTNADVRRFGETREVSGGELDVLAKIVTEGHLVDPSKEKIVSKVIELAGVPGIVENIVPIQQPGKIRRLLGRKASSEMTRR